jgi:hypothetical protein
MQLQETILKLIGEKLSFLSTDEYIANTDNADDFRQSIHPKARENKEDPAFNNIEYYQVFSSKFGFIPNLSIVDLLFNMGNSTIDILRKSSVEKPWQTH